MENFKIINQRENPLFKRKEIQISVEADVTPNHKNVGMLLSEKFSRNIENIKIKKISGKFGSNNFTISADIYDSPRDKESTEPEIKSMQEKKFGNPEDLSKKSTEQNLGEKQ